MPTITKKSCLLSQAQKLSKFALKLYEPDFICSEHSRVRRWKTKDIQKIRSFQDKNKSEEKILRYQHLNEEQILEQRVRHYLPGTERLLKHEPYRDIYAFPTDRGFGVIAQLVYQETAHNGILYFGIDKTDLVFHKYFEDVDFNSKKLAVFQDVQSQQYLPEKNELDEGWNCSGTFNVEANKEGILNFKYLNHEIHIYPLNQELFQKELAKVN